MAAFRTLLTIVLLVVVTAATAAGRGSTELPPPAATKGPVPAALFSSLRTPAVDPAALAVGDLSRDAAARIAHIKAVIATAYKAETTDDVVQKSLQDTLRAWKWAVFISNCGTTRDCEDIYTGAAVLRACESHPESCIDQGALMGIDKGPMGIDMRQWAVFWTSASLPVLGSMRIAVELVQPVLNRCLPAGDLSYDDFAKCVVDHQGDGGVFVTDDDSVIGSFDPASFVVASAGEVKVVIMPPLTWYRASQ